MVAAIRKYWVGIALLALLARVVSGVSQVLEGRGRHHLLIEFAAGVVSAPLYLAIGTAVLLSTLYIGAAICERIPARRGLHPSSEPGDGLMAVSILLGLLLTGIWAIPVFWVVSQIPVVSEQIDRMGSED